jgi:hypothetical protein
MRQRNSALARRCVAFGLAALLAQFPFVAHAQGKPGLPPPPPVSPLSLPQGIALDPPVPCADRPVTILVTVPSCDSCQVVGTFLRELRIDMFTHGDCATDPACARETVALPLGWLSAGFHNFDVTLREIRYSGVTPLDTTETHLDVQMNVAAACSDSAGQLPEAWVAVGRADLLGGNPPFACAGSPVPVLVGGMLPSRCWSVRKVELVPSPLTVIGPPTLRIWLNDISPCVRMFCPMVPVPWNVDTVLPALPRGDYRLRVQLAYATCFDTSVPDSVHDALYAFQVRADCPPGEWLPYIDRIQIGTPPCETCPPVVCSGQPFTVTLAGTLPDNCVAFRGVQLIPSMDMSPIGHPPSIRVRFAVNDCLGMPCVLRPTRWSATVAMPAWVWNFAPAVLAFESTQESMCDSTRLLAKTAIGRPVRLAEDCPPQPLCLNHAWTPAPRGTCNATFVNDTASADLRIASPVALAGLQGVLEAQPGLEIRGLHPIGPASGMTLEWTKTPRGAAFVLFASSGAPIPAFVTAPGNPYFDYAPVLHVEVKAVPYISIPEAPPVTVFTLRADSLLGADSLGRGVPMCPIVCPAYMAGPCGPVARFCAGARCDVNLDGHSDVRDLVLMVRCLFVDHCYDAVDRFDCDGDSTFSIQDVICCARSMLHGYEPGGGGRPEPSIALGFGDPVHNGDALTVPLTLTGADRVGAARVALRFPSDRYDVDGLGLDGNPPGWLALYDVEGSDVVLGLVALDASQAGATLPLTLRLRLHAGAQHGGEVVAREADVSAADGVALETAIAGSGAVIDPSSPIALSAPRPNPAPGAVRFALTLPRPTDVDLAVHDLAGRRVATLHRGSLAAGVHPFTWDGRTDRGDTARDGVYFVRLRAGGTEVARKTVLMRGH